MDFCALAENHNGPISNAILKVLLVPVCDSDYVLHPMNQKHLACEGIKGHVYGPISGGSSGGHWNIIAFVIAEMERLYHRIVI